MSKNKKNKNYYKNKKLIERNIKLKVTCKTIINVQNRKSPSYTGALASLVENIVSKERYSFVQTVQPTEFLKEYKKFLYI